jgi:hypothetical protein
MLLLLFGCVHEGAQPRQAGAANEERARSILLAGHAWGRDGWVRGFRIKGVGVVVAL